MLEEVVTIDLKCAIRVANLMERTPWMPNSSKLMLWARRESAFKFKLPSLRFSKKSNQIWWRAVMEVYIVRRAKIALDLAFITRGVICISLEAHTRAPHQLKRDKVSVLCAVQLSAGQRSLQRHDFVTPSPAVCGMRIKCVQLDGAHTYIMPAPCPLF